MKPGTLVYQATAAADVVVTSKPALLHKILIGKDVATSTVEVSDHASDGDANVKIYFEGSTLMTATGGCVEVNAVFQNGITADLTNQTNVAFIYSPLT